MKHLIDIVDIARKDLHLKLSTETTWNLKSLAQKCAQVENLYNCMSFLSLVSCEDIANLKEEELKTLKSVLEEHGTKATKDVYDKTLYLLQEYKNCKTDLAIALQNFAGTFFSSGKNLQFFPIPSHIEEFENFYTDYKLLSEILPRRLRNSLNSNAYEFSEFSPEEARLVRMALETDTCLSAVQESLILNTLRF
jgi:hypothetical protein